MLEEKHKNGTKNKIRSIDDQGQPASPVASVQETSKNSQATVFPQISLSAEEFHFNSSPAPGYLDRLTFAGWYQTLNVLSC